VYYTVMWRAGGTAGGKQESEVFDEEPTAERFKDLVNGHGQNWPPGWIRGQGFVAERRRAETMFEPFALAYVDRLTGIQGDTRAKYKKDVLDSMVPWFGPYSVEDGEGSILRSMVQDWVNDLEAGRRAPLESRDRKPRTAYKPKTIHNKHGLLSAIMQSAVDAETSLRASNPCAKTRLPRLDSTEDEEEIVFLEREEWAWIYECLRDDAKDLAETIAETGFRWGEATALQPRDLRRRNGRPAIRVQRAWKKDEDGKSVLGPPKTRKSRRTVWPRASGRGRTVEPCRRLRRRWHVRPRRWRRSVRSWPPRRPSPRTPRRRRQPRFRVCGARPPPVPPSGTRAGSP
jgi:integrase